MGIPSPFRSFDTTPENHVYFIEVEKMGKKIEKPKVSVMPVQAYEKEEILPGLRACLDALPYQAGNAGAHKAEHHGAESA